MALAIIGCRRLCRVWAPRIRPELVLQSEFGLVRALRVADCNPSRKLRRFESFTCHHLRKRPLTCSDALQGLVAAGPTDVG